MATVIHVLGTNGILATTSSTLRTASPHPKATSSTCGQTRNSWPLSTVPPSFSVTVVPTTNNTTVTMFNMFIEALRQMAVRPRRFMLQTGSKQYGFYLGPAAIPAFESDPRVQIDRNFYYEQEDVLSNYCQSVGAAWNVARPSYIVGAVRDGTLNHLIGFGIYAAVQAHLGQSIAFPGDYRAWDREQVQSTGLLNAYFEEWLVLTGKTANEAFNIHDGLSFTWGRLWPYLAQWYNAEWSAPAEDESKYRVMQLPSPQTPRG